MGVDYTAHKGIGFKINTDKEGFDYREFLEEITANTDYYFFEVGAECYSGEMNEIYVVLNDIKPLYNLEKRMKNLEIFIKSNKLEIDGNCDLVGGLEVW